MTGIPGPVSNQVEISNGQVRKCHVDHLRAHLESAVGTSQPEKESDNDVDIPVWTPSIPQPETSVSVIMEDHQASDTTRRYPQRDRNPPDWYRPN